MSSTSKFTCRNCGGGDRGRVAIYRPFGEVSLSLNRTVTCMVLKANDRRTSCPCHDEFRGPRSDYVRQQDNARPRTIRVAMNCLIACKTLFWPARSLDLSPIEQVWDMVGRQWATCIQARGRSTPF
ncbi:uncharacterized protein TNCV_3632021 [Trichonephila clavipes]|nr:uncharacterized protein TNCV_3632021 [Trichonephila clavipes]